MLVVFWSIFLHIINALEDIFLLKKSETQIFAENQMHSLIQQMEVG